MERLNKETWVAVSVVVALILGLSNYSINGWTIYLSFSAGFTVGHFGFWLETKILNWLDKIGE